MILFLKLLLTHILGDFVFQTEMQIKDKEKNKIKSLQLYIHIAIHTLLLLLILDFSIKKYWLGIAIIIISHYFFDVVKAYYQQKKNKRIWFFIDQGLHLTAILIVTNIYSDINFYFTDLLTTKVLLFVVSLLLVTSFSAVVIKVVITQWNPESKKQHDDSLAKAGRYIGILERLFVFTFIITNNWQAIGFLLAAKSVFRFGDLTSAKDRKLTEYILIGTLLSFGLAVLIGVLYLQVIKNI
ncbi:DUF3307 domain-containing protein [Polaribacter tangerinus]|uniref:DUF3307 domain-containing protein n=1 Tax=Polaribacter tangerinus TaxID=1920034 RepID=UPI000B4BBF41|nr:DUF3307 domain-containing protein [Polaribacter tangerinus]